MPSYTDEQKRMAVDMVDECGGSVNLRELIRRLAEDVVNAIMDAEADQLRSGGANSRNGYRERNLATCIG